jgi:hypothetical protein
MRVVSLNSIPAQPTKGSIGLVDLIPDGDRGPTFGNASSGGISLGKIAGFWTAPYDGIITAVTLSVDQGGVTVRFYRRRGSRGGVPSSGDIINRHGYTVMAPATGGAHRVFTNLTDFLDVNVFKGDVFTTEIVNLFDPKPTDVGGNILVQQTGGEMPSGVETLELG